MQRWSTHDKCVRPRGALYSLLKYDQPAQHPTWGLCMVNTAFTYGWLGPSPMGVRDLHLRVSRWWLGHQASPRALCGGYRWKTPRVPQAQPPGDACPGSCQQPRCFPTPRAWGMINTPERGLVSTLGPGQAAATTQALLRGPAPAASRCQP